MSGTIAEELEAMEDEMDEINEGSPASSVDFLCYIRCPHVCMLSRACLLMEQTGLHLFVLSLPVL